MYTSLFVYMQTFLYQNGFTVILRDIRGLHTMAQDDPDVVVVLTTVPADFDVEPLARGLLEARLAACVNVLPRMRSIYRWQGRVETAGEHLLIVKTRRDRVPDLEAALAAAHPYEVPEFLVLPVSGGSAAYLAWVAGESRAPEA
jgi:periplasmic divalent cation tolerance protein